MKLDEVTKKQFLKQLKNPEQAALVEIISSIRTGLKHMYMDMEQRPKIRKGAKGYKNVAFLVDAPGIRDGAELSHYRNYIEDVVNKSFGKLGRHFVLDDVVFHGENRQFSVLVWLL